MLALVLFAALGAVPIWWVWKLLAVWPLFLFVMFLEFRAIKRRLPFEVEDQELIAMQFQETRLPAMRIAAIGFAAGWAAKAIATWLA